MCCIVCIHIELKLIFTLISMHFGAEVILSGKCQLSNKVQKQKLRAPAKYSAEWKTRSLVHRKVPVSLTACGHCKLSHNQSSAATSLRTKKLSPHSPSGLSRESAACRLSQTVISERGGKPIAWLTHHNLEGKWIPPSSTWGEGRLKEKLRGRREERKDREAGKRTLGLIETHGRWRITWRVRAHPHSWPGCLSKLFK